MRFLPRAPKTIKPTPASGIVAGSGVSCCATVLELQLISSPGAKVKKKRSLTEYGKPTGGSGATFVSWYAPDVEISGPEAPEANVPGGQATPKLETVSIAFVGSMQLWYARVLPGKPVTTVPPM
jgi:hypothetical protein